MSGARLLGTLRVALAPYGLNLLGAALPQAYDASVPQPHRLAAGGEWVRSVVVVGHGGGGFWSAFRAHAVREPDLERRAHPLDDFTSQVMHDVALPAVTTLGVRAVLRLPFDTAAPPLSFVHLAEAAGLGRRGLVGVLVHPEFGPWVALRGALLVDVAVRAARPAAGFDPCGSCVERPCIAACPAAAVTHPGGWDVPRCLAHRLAHRGACAERCDARHACVYGHVHRYPAAALAYHHGRAFAAMTAHAAAR